MNFAWHRWPAAPDRKVSPVHAAVVAMGGQMGAYGGWDRANWFAAPGGDTSEAAIQTWGRAGPSPGACRAPGASGQPVSPTTGGGC